MAHKYREQGAFQHQPGGGQSTNYISKHKQRNKALEIVFDPKDHKEYLTGFRKRKQQRRKDAFNKLEQRQRQQRVEERAERRAAMKEQMAKQLGIRTDGGASSSGEEQSGSEEDEEEEPVKVYQSGQLTSTVTVTAMPTNSDSEQEERKGDGEEDAAGEEGGGGEDGNQPAHPARQQQQLLQQKQPRLQYGAHKQRNQSGGSGAATGQGGKKMSKHSLRIMAKTKMKLEGKKGRGTQAGFAKHLASSKKFKPGGSKAGRGKK